MSNTDQPSILVLADVPVDILSALSSRGRIVGQPVQAPATGTPSLTACEIVIVRSPYRLDRPTIESLPGLRWVIRAGAGLDNIDIATATARGIVLHSTPVGAPAVAELAIGLLIACARDIPRLDASMKQGEWLKPNTCGTSLFGKTLLIVGFGRVGQRIARAAAGLGMDILVADRTPRAGGKEEVIRSLGSARFISFDDGLPRADVLVLCCPLTEETRDLLSKERIWRLPRGAILVNVARGGVVDQDALLDALDDGQLRGAGLDVHEPEPPGRTRLLEHPRVVATPHVGAQTLGTQELVMKEVIRLLDEVVLPEWRTARGRS